MKNKYHLKVLFPSTNINYPERFYLESILADRFYINDGAYYFCNKGGKIICCYPAPYTIIESIEELKNGEE